MRIVFMGTPDFAAKALKAIYEAGHEVVCVVTQPDKEKGRGKSVSESPVKQLAKELGLTVITPAKMKSAEAIEELRQYPADMFVVAAYGQILKQEVLDMPRLGSINIHASLLPKYRGAAPIQWAILDGLKETGVTIMHMDAGIDTGNIIMQEKIEIEDTDTGESLFDKLADLGAKAIVKAIPLIEKGELTETPQNHDESSYAKMLSKEMGLIDFSNDARVIERWVRGLNSWPSAYTYLNGKQLKIWVSEVVEDTSDVKPGIVIAVDKKSFTIKCGVDALKLKEIQLEGKKRMEVGAFLLGYKVSVGDILG